MSEVKSNLHYWNGHYSQSVKPRIKYLKEHMSWGKEIAQISHAAWCCRNNNNNKQAAQASLENILMQKVSEARENISWKHTKKHENISFKNNSNT